MSEIRPFTAPSLHALERRIASALDIRDGEFAALVGSFCYFFALLTAYYIVRPVREEMGVMLGTAALKDVFVYVFAVMVVAVPVFGWIVSKFEQRRIVPIVYLFFIVQLAVFWLVMRSGQTTPLLAKCFFVWVSVFNLFVISLFWSVMSSHWRADQAKRLYGVIAAGGTIGALTGPLITQLFASVIGPTNLLLVAMLFLGLALMIAISITQGRVDDTATVAAPGATTWTGILQGARRAWEDPFLFRIALWVLLANLISTFFYFEQASIVGAAITDRTERVQLFARIDFAVGVLTILAQFFGTARIIQRFGLGMAAASLPATAMLAFVVLAIAPTLAVIVAIVVAERAIHFSLSGPAAKVFWTVVEPDDKYKAQNFVDTVVYRGGDAASGWYFDLLSKSLGLGTAGIADVTLPLAAVWFAVSFDLARRFNAHATPPKPST